MSSLILRIIGALLALLGLVAVVVGGWFLAAIGTSGSATFTSEPESRVVVLDPDVLNRVDQPVEVTAEGGGTVWAGTARPSDADALLADSSRVEIDGVGVREWVLTSSEVGDGGAVDAGSLDIWQASTSAPETVTTTIDQSHAPQTLIITAPEGEQVEQVQLAVADEGWSTTALGVLIGGGVALLLGIALVVRAGRPGTVRRRTRTGGRA